MRIKMKWSHSQRVQMTYSEINQLINDFRVKQIKELSAPSTKIEDWIDYNNHTGVFSVNKRKLVNDSTDPLKWDGKIEVYFHDATQNRIVYWAAKRTKDEVLNSQVKVGKIVREKYESLTGKRMRDSFGVTNSKHFSKVVPKPVYYMNPTFNFRTVGNVKLIDVTSMYPASMQGKLPTVNGMQVINGRVAPTADYPFAFYLNSHHCAEFNRFDTHDYTDRKIPRELVVPLTTVRENGKMVPKYKQVPDCEEVTVLMKASEQEMTSTFDYFYSLKEASEKGSVEYDSAKLVMNKFIGTLHYNPDKRKDTKGLGVFDYYHLAAIAKGRANQTIIDQFKGVQDDGNVVLQVVVDSIIYIKLVDDDRGITEKKLGKFLIEYDNCLYRTADSPNRYVIADYEGNVKKAVVSGYEAAAQAITKLQDIDKYRRVNDEQEN